MKGGMRATGCIYVSHLGNRVRPSPTQKDDLSSLFFKSRANMWVWKGPSQPWQPIVSPSFSLFVVFPYPSPLAHLHYLFSSSLYRLWFASLLTRETVTLASAVSQAQFGSNVGGYMARAAECN